ncbi:hypothetical protein FRB98_008424 [Tulasnella sp. 332]|nr:hypothetical protein FRB98_008424 [Tulasnella sp. 332]
MQSERAPFLNPYEKFTGTDLDSFVSSIREKVGNALNRPRRSFATNPTEDYYLSRSIGDRPSSDLSGYDDVVREDTSPPAPRLDKGKGRALDDEQSDAFELHSEVSEGSQDQVLATMDGQADNGADSDGEEYAAEDAARYRKYYDLEDDAEEEEAEEYPGSAEAQDLEPAGESDRELSRDTLEHTQDGKDYNVIDEDGAIVIDSDEEDGDEDGRLQPQRSPEWAVDEGFEEETEEQRYQAEDEDEDELEEEADLPGDYTLEPQYDEEEADEIDEEQVSVYPVDRAGEFFDLERDDVHGDDDTFPIEEVEEDELERNAEEGQTDDLQVEESSLDFHDTEMRQTPAEHTISISNPQPQYNPPIVGYAPANFPFTTQDYPSQLDPTVVSALEALQQFASILPSDQQQQQATNAEQVAIHPELYDPMNGVPVFGYGPTYSSDIAIPAYSELPITSAYEESGSGVIDVDALDDGDGELQGGNGQQQMFAPDQVTSSLWSTANVDMLEQPMDDMGCSADSDHVTNEHLEPNYEVEELDDRPISSLDATTDQLESSALYDMGLTGQEALGEEAQDGEVANFQDYIEQQDLSEHMHPLYAGKAVSDPGVEGIDIARSAPEVLGDALADLKDSVSTLATTTQVAVASAPDSATTMSSSLIDDSQETIVGGVEKGAEIVAATKGMTYEATAATDDNARSIAISVQDNVESTTTALAEGAHSTLDPAQEMTSAAPDMDKEYITIDAIDVKDAINSAIDARLETNGATRDLPSTAVAAAADTTSTFADISGVQSMPSAMDTAGNQAVETISSIHPATASAVDALSESAGDTLQGSREALAKVAANVQAGGASIQEHAPAITHSMNELITQLACTAGLETLEKVAASRQAASDVLTTVNDEASSAIATLQDAAPAPLSATLATISAGEAQRKAASAIIDVEETANLVAETIASASVSITTPVMAARGSAIATVNDTVTSARDAPTATAHTLREDAADTTNALHELGSPMIAEGPENMVSVVQAVRQSASIVADPVNTTKDQAYEALRGVAGSAGSFLTSSQDTMASLAPDTQGKLVEMAKIPRDMTNHLQVQTLGKTLSTLASTKDITKSIPKEPATFIKDAAPSVTTVRNSTPVTSSLRDATAGDSDAAQEHASTVADATLVSSRSLYSKPSLTHTESAAVAEQLLVGDDSQLDALEDDPFSHMGDGLGGPEELFDSDLTPSTSGGEDEAGDEARIEHALKHSSGSSSDVTTNGNGKRPMRDGLADAQELVPSSLTDKDLATDARASSSKLQTEDADGDDIDGSGYASSSKDVSQPANGSVASDQPSRSPVQVVVEVPSLPAPAAIVRQNSINLYTHHHGPLPVRVEVQVPEHAAKDATSPTSTPDTPTIARSKSSHSRAPSVRDPNAAVTRSHCTFRKISIPILPHTPVDDDRVGTQQTPSAVTSDSVASGSHASLNASAAPSTEESPVQRTCFIVPGCTLSAFDVVKDDNIEDLGEATKAENDAKIPNFGLAPIDPSVFAALHRLVGHDYMNDTACAWLPSKEETASFEKLLNEYRQAQAGPKAASTPRFAEESLDTPASRHSKRKSTAGKYKVVLREGSAGPSSNQRSKLKRDSDKQHHRRRSSTATNGTTKHDDSDYEDEQKNIKGGARRKAASKSSPILTLNLLAATEDEDAEGSDADGTSSVAPSVSVSASAASARAPSKTAYARSPRYSVRLGKRNADQASVTGGDSYVSESDSDGDHGNATERPIKRARRSTRINSNTTARPLSLQGSRSTPVHVEEEPSSTTSQSHGPSHWLRSASITPSSSPGKGKKRAASELTSESKGKPNSKSADSRSTASHSPRKRRRVAKVGRSGSRAASVASVDDDRLSARTESSSHYSTPRGDLIEAVIDTAGRRAKGKGVAESRK